MEMYKLKQELKRLEGQEYQVMGNINISRQQVDAIYQLIHHFDIKSDEILDDLSRRNSVRNTHENILKKSKASKSLEERIEEFIFGHRGVHKGNTLQAARISLLKMRDQAEQNLLFLEQTLRLTRDETDDVLHKIHKLRIEGNEA